MTDEPEEPRRRPQLMSRFGLATASLIWGRKRSIEMFHQRRAECDQDILTLAPKDEVDGRQD